MPPPHSLDEFIAALARHPEGFEGLFARMGYVPLLPLLEFPYQHVASEMPAASIKAGLPEDVVNRVSLRDLVVTALRSDSAYWTGLAVLWLENAFPVDLQVVLAVDEMVGKQVATQAARHAAYTPEQEDVDGLRRRWAPHLNQHHLFDDLQQAAAFMELSDERVSGHSPFFVYGLYRLPKGGHVAA